MRTLSIILNLIIFLVTSVIVTCFFYVNGKWDRHRGLALFRYFTTLSNVACGFSALLMLIAQISGNVPFLVWLLKYLSTAALGVTLFTVLLFLGPTQGYDEAFKGLSLFLHLINPLLALISFIFCEKGGRFGLGLILVGMLPVVIYGMVYLYKILYAPEGERWSDFYGFNSKGQWRRSLVMMLIGSFLICLLLAII